MIEKKADDRFRRAFDVFREEQIRRMGERQTQMSRERVNQVRSVGTQGFLDPYPPRFSAYQSFTKNIGEDFVANLQNILIPNCDELSSDNINDVTQELQRLFIAQLGACPGFSVWTCR